MGNSSYMGDWTVVLPDNSRNILYQGQQLQEIARQRQAAEAAQAKADAERDANYSKIIADGLDPSKVKDQDLYALLAMEDLAKTQNKLLQTVQQRRLAGKPMQEGEVRGEVASQVARINGDHNTAQQKQKEIADAVAALKGPGIDDKKLLGLAINEYFTNIDPTNGKRSIDPTKWNKDLHGADVVKNILEKHYGVVGDNKGVDQAISEVFGKDNKVNIDSPTETDPNTGQIKKVGYKATLNSFQEIKKDAAGNPLSVDIRQEPVLLPNGKPLLNIDGTPKTTVAKDVERKFLDTYPGLAVQIKKELADKIGNENMIRKSHAEANGLPFLPISDEEADIIKSDIVLDKLRKNMPPTPINKDDTGQKQFDNQLALERLRLAKEDNWLAADRLKFEKAKQNKETPEITPLTISIANARGVDIPSYDGKTNTRVVYTKDIGQKEQELIAGYVEEVDLKGNKTIEPKVLPLKTNNGNKYYEVLENGDWKGQDSKGVEKIIPKEQVADEQLKYYTKDDLPASSKGNRPKFVQKVVQAAQSIKKALTPARKYSIINPKTGQAVMMNVDKEAAKIAEAKGYKII
jgi:hypothetical protein